ncbi:methyl-accepting chemotaxis protein, partial [Microbacteriaceae bacterium K1510]|nr:methyl-accepting chemotaxis protein [Microbacteriaceae bacterium K1510]
MLLGLFGLMALIIAGQGVLSLMKMSQVNDAAVDIQTNWLPSVSSLGQLGYTASAYRNGLARHVLNTDPNEMVRIEKSLQDREGALRQIQARYEKLITSPEEQAGYESFKQHWALHQAVTPEVIKLSRANKTAEAAALFTGDQLKAFVQLGEDIEKLVKINTDGAEQAARTADANFQNARTLTIGIISVSLLIAIGACVLVMMHISRPLSALVAPLEQIKGGNFAVAVPGTHRDDEIGAIAKAVDGMAGQVRQTISEIKQSAMEVNNASGEISTSTTDLSQ